MWPLEKEEEEQTIILISDDDDDDGDEAEGTQGSSVLFVEPQGKSCSPAAAAGAL